MARKLSAFWHQAQMWCMNCFAGTHSDVLGEIACVQPLDLLSSYTKYQVNRRVLCSPPEINPAMANLSPSLKTPSPHCRAC